MEQYYLGIDCGLTSIKVIVFNRLGQIIRKESKKNEVLNGIIDTQSLWDKIVVCLKEAVTGIAQQIVGISVCGHGNGVYFITNGKPYKYAYSSMYVGADIDDKRISDITLQTVWAGQPLNILSKIKSTDKLLYKSIDKIFFCKDFIRYMLTGKIATDYSDASAAGILDNNSYSISKDLYSLFRLDGVENLIPDIYYSYDCGGYITEDAEKMTGLIQGTPVAIGAFDVCGCIIGSGIKDDSDYSIIAGTWGINAALCKNKIKDSRITQSCSFIDKNYNLCIESAPTSCVNLEWFLKNVCPYVSYQEILDIVELETDVIYLPYIYPTMRKPLQRADFLNLKIEHTYKDMIKAILEGVVFEHRLQIESLMSVGLKRKEVVISGGATNNPGWCQLFADILDLPIRTTLEKECGALGAAIFATIVSGTYKDIESAQNTMVKYDKIFNPQRNYDNKYKKFLEVLRRNDGFRA